MTGGVSRVAPACPPRLHLRAPAAAERPSPHRIALPVARPKIVFQETPNPLAGKFTVGRTLVEGRRGRTYDSPEAAAGEPIAARLLAEPGVRSVFIVADFVTVTRDPSADWSELVPRITRVLRDLL